MLYRRQLIKKETEQLMSEKIDIINDSNNEQINDSNDNSIEEITIPTDDGLTDAGDYLWENIYSQVGFNGYYDSDGLYHNLYLLDFESTYYYCRYERNEYGIIEPTTNNKADVKFLILQDGVNPDGSSKEGSKNLLRNLKWKDSNDIEHSVSEIDDFPNKIFGFKNLYPCFYSEPDLPSINNVIYVFCRGIYDLFYKLYYPNLTYEGNSTENQTMWESGNTIENNDNDVGYPLVTNEEVYCIFADVFKWIDKYANLYDSSTVTMPVLLKFVFDMQFDKVQKLFFIIKKIGGVDKFYHPYNYDDMILACYKGGDFESCFKVHEYCYDELIYKIDLYNDKILRDMIYNKFYLQAEILKKPMIHSPNNNLSYPNNDYNNNNENIYFYDNYIRPRYHFIRTFDSEFTSYFTSTNEIDETDNMNCLLYNVVLHPKGTTNDVSYTDKQLIYSTLGDFYNTYDWTEYNEAEPEANQEVYNYDNRRIASFFNIQRKIVSGQSTETYTFQIPLLRISKISTNTIESQLETLKKSTDSTIRTNLNNIIALVKDMGNEIKGRISHLTGVFEIPSYPRGSKTVEINGVDCYLIEECEVIMEAYRNLSKYCNEIATFCEEKSSEYMIYVDGVYFGGFIGPDNKNCVPHTCPENKYPYKYYKNVQGKDKTGERATLWRYFSNNDQLLKFAINRTVEEVDLTSMSEIKEECIKNSVYWGYINFQKRYLKNNGDNKWILSYSNADANITYTEIIDFNIYYSDHNDLIFKESLCRDLNNSNYNYTRIINDVYLLLKNADSKVLKLITQYFSNVMFTKNIVYFLEDDDRDGFYNKIGISGTEIDSKNLGEGTSSEINKLPVSTELPSFDVFDPFKINNEISKKLSLENIFIPNTIDTIGNINVTYFNKKIYPFCNLSLQYVGDDSNDYSSKAIFQVNSTSESNPMVIPYYVDSENIEFEDFDQNMDKTPYSTTLVYTDNWFEGKHLLYCYSRSITFKDVSDYEHVTNDNFNSIPTVTITGMYPILNFNDLNVALSPVLSFPCTFL